MREIKFRAWDKPKKTLFYWAEVVVSMLGVGTGKPHNIFDNETVVLMQYTGLKDKNGLDIYEGDIIKGDHCDGGGSIKDGVVEFNSAAWAIKGISYLLRSFTDLEVIGNIYENPKLIEVEE